MSLFIGNLGAVSVLRVSPLSLQGILPFVVMRSLGMGFPQPVYKQRPSDSRYGAVDTFQFQARFGQTNGHSCHPLQPFQHQVLNLLNRNRGKNIKYTPKELRLAFNLLPPSFQGRILRHLRRFKKDNLWPSIKRQQHFNFYEEAADLRIAVLRAQMIYYLCLTPEDIAAVKREIIEPAQARETDFSYVYGRAAHFFRDQYNRASPDSMLRLGMQQIQQDNPDIQFDYLIRILALLAINLSLFQESWAEVTLLQYGFQTIAEEAQEVLGPMEMFYKHLGTNSRHQNDIQLYRGIFDSEGIEAAFRNLPLETRSDDERLDIPTTILESAEELLGMINHASPFNRRHGLTIALNKQRVRSALHYSVPDLRSNSERKRISKLSEMLELSALFVSTMTSWHSESP